MSKNVEEVGLEVLKSEIAQSNKIRSAIVSLCLALLLDTIILALVSFSTFCYQTHREKTNIYIIH